jgi:hypothetical protein
MQKINPYDLPRPSRPVEERVFDADGVSVVIAFRRPDAADMNMAAEVAKRLTKDYITGYPEEGTPPAEFFDGIKVSEALFMLAATGQEMQPPEKKVYTAEEFVMLMDRLETDGVRIARWINEKQQDWRRHQGNGSGAPTETSSEARSASTPSIPRSPSAATTSSEA